MSKVTPIDTKAKRLFDAISKQSNVESVVYTGGETAHHFDIVVNPPPVTEKISIKIKVGGEDV